MSQVTGPSEPEDPGEREPLVERNLAMARAVEWVGRIMAVSLLMFLPGVAGQWLDRRWGSRWIGPTLFVVGFVLGFTALLSLTRQANKRK